MREELLGVRQVVVDDLAYALDVQPPGGHVRCDQDGGFAGAKVEHHALAGVLAEVPLECADRVAERVELLGQFLDAVLGLAEDEDRGIFALVQQRLQSAYLVALLDGVDEVLHRGDRLHPGVHLDCDGAVQVLGGGLRHPLWHGR